MFSAIVYSGLKNVAQKVSKIAPKDLFLLVVTLTFDLHILCAEYGYE